MKFGTLYAYWGNQWSCDYEKTAKKVAEIGFDILEVGADHIYHMSDKELTELDQIAKGYGLTLTTNCGPAKEYDMASKDPAVRQNGLDYLSGILKNMTKINSKSLIGAIYSFWPNDFVDVDKEGAWERSIEQMKKLGKVAEDLDIECALEVLNRNETYILTDCAEAKEYCRRVGSTHVNILLDTYHMNIEEDSITDAIRNAGDLLGHVHVGECNRKLPGMNGTIDWVGLGKALRDINYQKAVVMEPFLLKGGAVGKDIRVWRDLSNQADEKMMDQYIRDSLVFLKKNLQG